MSDGEDLLAEQRARWEAGDRARVEATLAAHPELAREAVVDLVYQELVLREEAGEQPRLDEYLERFPHLAAELRVQLEVHQAFADDTLLAPSPGTPGGTASPARAIPPRAIPGYVIEGVLGHGGMGVVLVAEQRSLGRKVALKILPPEASEDAEALRRFHQEARAASSLNHPHICTIFDFGAHDGRPFIVMELVEGRTLAATPNEERPIARTAELGRQIAEALAAAHAAGVVHRDIKPANVMVRGDGYVKVLDFGLARLLAAAEPGDAQSARGVLVGTPRYMSPEQVRGDSVGPPSDVFSLGVVLCELVTGRHPFAAATLAQTLAAVEAAAPPRSALAEAAVREDLVSLILRMLDARAAQRPTMRDVAAELAAITAASASAGKARSSGAPAPRAPRSRWSRLALPALLLAALVPILWRWRTADDRAPHTSTPLVLVLPFTAAGGDDQAYLGTGVTEDITSMLARSPEIAVLSSGALQTYDGGLADVKRLGRELGVAYVLEGTVRKESDHVRIVAQLVDARTGLDVWSERFDRAGADPWALQDEVTGKIVGALTGEYGQLKRAEYRAAWGSDSTQLDAYDLYLRGHELYMRLTPADNERAGEVWRAGLERYPHSALLQVKLGFHHFMRPYLYLQDGAAPDYARASALAGSALAEPHLSPLERRLGHWLLAYVSAQEGDYERALREVDTTHALAPYDSFQAADLCSIRILAGQTDEALRVIDGAMRADPSSRPFYQQLRGWALTVAGRHAESATALEESLDLPVVPLLRAINLVHLNRLPEARAQVEKARALRPDLSRARWQSANFYRARAVLDQQLADLEAAGLP